MESAHPWIRTRLSAMMFIEFFIWASWMGPISTYAEKTLGFTSPQWGWIFSTIAIAGIVSPLFVGYVADRLFATERILCVLHLIGAACMFLAAQQTEFPRMLALMMVNSLCFMPTLALANSLAFRNIPDPDKFPRIAMLGTIGWIASSWIVDYALGGPMVKNFFYLAGGAGVLMGLYCLTLPHTPPKGREAGGDVLGLGALSLLKQPAFLAFMLCAFLISIPATFYFPFCPLFLTETGWSKPIALMTIGQFTEIFVMFTMPWFIAWLGLRRVLLLGMAVWATRYLLFSTVSAPLVLLGLLVHGFGYCFVYVGAYIYVDKNAPRDLRASAQSLVSLLMLGVGWFIGAQLAGYTGQSYPVPVTIAASDAEGKKSDVSLPRWVAKPDEKKPDVGALLDKNADGKLSPDEQAAVPVAGLTIDEKTYARADLLGAFEKLAMDGSVSRDAWVAAQAERWRNIWLWPAVGAAIAGLIFMFAPQGKEQQADAPG